MGSSCGRTQGAQIYKVSMRVSGRNLHLERQRSLGLYWHDSWCLKGFCFGRAWKEYEGLPWWLIGKESACQAGDAGSIPGSGRSSGEGIGYPLQHDWASLVVQSVICLQCGRPAFNPWVGKIPWTRERLYPLQYSCLENSTDCRVLEVTKSQTQLSNFHFH